MKCQITKELGGPMLEQENGAKKRDSGEWKSQQSWLGVGEKGGGQDLE